MTYDVFISFSILNKEIARNIYDKLQEQHISSFLGRTGFLYHKKFYSKVNKAIRASHLVLVLLSYRSIHSKHVQHEIEEAKKHHKPIIYLYLNPVKNSFMDPSQSNEKEIICYPKDENKIIELKDTIKKVLNHTSKQDVIEMEEPPSSKKTYSLGILFPYISLFLTFSAMLFFSFLIWQKLYGIETGSISLFHNLFFITIGYFTFFIINVGGIPSLIYQYTYAARGLFTGQEGREIKTRAYFLSVITILFETISFYFFAFFKPSLVGYIVIFSLMMIGLIIYCVYIIYRKFIISILQSLTIWIQVFLGFSIVCSITFFCNMIPWNQFSFSSHNILIATLTFVTTLSYLILVYIDTNMRLIFGLSYHDVFRILGFMVLNFCLDAIFSSIAMTWVKKGIGLTILVIYAILMVFLRGWIHALSSADVESLEREQFKKVTSFIGVIPMSLFIYLFFFLTFTCFYRLLLPKPCIFDKLPLILHLIFVLLSFIILICMIFYFTQFHLNQRTIQKNIGRFFFDLFFLVIILLMMTCLSALCLYQNSIGVILNWMMMIFLGILSFQMARHALIFSRSSIFSKMNRR